MSKVIGIIGTRSRDTLGDLAKTERSLTEIFEDGDSIVSGGCPRGGDRFAEILARQFGCPITIYHANWKKHGKAAGFARNEDIALEADTLIAVVSKDRTGGTEDTILKFEKSGGSNLILV